MTTAFFTSAGPSAPAGSSAPAGFWVPANILAPTDSPGPTGLVFSPHAGLPVV